MCIISQIRPKAINGTYRKLSHIPLVSDIPLGMGFHLSQLHPSPLVYSPRLRKNLYPSGGVYKALVIYMINKIKTMKNLPWGNRNTNLLL